MIWPFTPTQATTVASIIKDLTAALYRIQHELPAQYDFNQSYSLILSARTRLQRHQYVVNLTANPLIAPISTGTVTVRQGVKQSIA